jgi:hypothetical protein
VGQDHGVGDCARVEQILDVLAYPFGGVVAVDEHEVHVPLLRGRLGEERWQQFV